MLGDHGLDRRRVYVTGTSSGGAMTTVMLATYPEVFAGGAVIAGVPYRTAKGLQEGLESIFQGRSRSARREWGELVRAASPHQGPWPKVSVWHGDADTAVKPVNAEEIIKQWADMHGLDLQPTIQMTVDGYPRRVWQGPTATN
jgi:poly(hydroxyalkanoate) depolymerase family esterase